MAVSVIGRDYIGPAIRSLGCGRISDTFIRMAMKNAKRKVGRPKIGERVLVTLPAGLIRRVDEFGDANFGMTRADALRTLLELGLDHDGNENDE